MIFSDEIDNYLSHYSKRELLYGTFLFLTFDKTFIEVPISYNIFKLYLIHQKKFNKNNNDYILNLYNVYIDVCKNKVYMNSNLFKKNHCFDCIMILTSNILITDYYLLRGYTLDEAKMIITSLANHSYIKKENLWEVFVNTYTKISRTLKKHRKERINEKTGQLYTETEVFKFKKNTAYNHKYTNALECSLKTILFNSNGYLLDKPISEDIFMLCMINDNNVNPNNSEFIHKQYNYYIKQFENYNFLNIKEFYIYNNFFNYKTSSPYNILYWLNRGYTKQDAAEIISSKLSNNSLKKEKLIELYGEIKGLEIFNEYLNKRRNTFNIHKLENPMHGVMYTKTIDPETGEFYTGERLIQKRLEVCRANWYKGSLLVALRIKEGKIKTVWHKEFWINKGFTEEEAIQQIVNIMGKSNIEYFIEKYGYEEGTKRFNLRSEKYKNTMNNKSDEEKLEIIKKRAIKSYKVSKSSIIFFNEVINRLKTENIVFNKIYMNNNEYYIYDYEYKTIYFYDLCIEDINLIVEYNGIKYHPYYTIEGKELEEWKSLFFNTPGTYQRERDLRKLYIAETNGFTFITVWDIDEIEYSINKIISKIKEKLNIVNYD